MAFLQSRVKASHDEIFSVGEYTSNRAFQNYLYYLWEIYGANIRYDNHERPYVMEIAGAFHLNLKISKAEFEAITAGLGMSAHYLPADIISYGTEIVRSTMAASPVAEVFSMLRPEEYPNSWSCHRMISTFGAMSGTWTPSNTEVEETEGWVILTAEVPGLYEVARWVMSGAPYIEVICGVIYFACLIAPPATFYLSVRHIINIRSK